MKHSIFGMVIPSAPSRHPGVLVVLASAFSAVAQPATAQAAQYSGYASAGTEFVGHKDYNHPSPTGVAYSISNPEGSANISVSELNNGTIDARASGNASTWGAINYRFQVEGDPDILVPVRVQAKGAAGGTGSYGYAYGTLARFDLSYTDYFGQFLVAATSVNSPYYGPSYGDGVVDVDQVIYMRSNVDNTLQLTAYANAGSNFASYGTAFAYIDPIFTIDPAFADRFKITGLPLGITSPGGVPEPTTWVAMLAGFGAIGAAMRRRRQVAQA